MELHHSVARLLELHKARLERAEVQVEASSPKRIMALGFAVVRQGGKALKSVNEVAVGESVEITLADGTARADITETTK